MERTGTGKRALWRSIRRTFGQTKGRFLSIVALIALGCFALVGLQVTGPDMRATAERYFGEYRLADISIIADLGIDDDDAEKIAQASDIETLELGYLVDVTFEGTTDAIRVFSAPHEISDFELVEGAMPSASDEIALDVADADDHPIGSEVTLEEKPAEDGSYALAGHTFTVVGYVNSPEIIATSTRGATQSGTGSLVGYAVVPEAAFDVDYHMIARLSFTDTAGLDPYSQEYLDRVSAHKEELDELLADQPEHRLQTVRAAYEDAIKSGQEQMDEARSQLDEAKAALDDAAEQIAAAQAEIASYDGQLADAAAQLASGREQLSSTKATLDASADELDRSAQVLVSSKAQLDAAKRQIDAGEAEIASKQEEYDAAVAALDEARAQAAEQAQAAQDQIDAAREPLEAGRVQVEQAVSDLEGQVEQARAAYADAEDQLAELDGQLAALDPQSTAYAELSAQRERLAAQLAQLQEGLASLEAGLAQAQAAQDTFMNVDADAQTPGDDGGYTALIAQLDAKQQELDESVAEGESQLAEKQAQLDGAATELEAARQELSVRTEEFNAATAAYDEGVASYNEGLSAYRAGVASWNAAADELERKSAEYDEGVAQLEAARQELSAREAEYEEGLSTYEEQLPEAEADIAAANDELASAKTTLAGLELPSYNVYNRREIPGSEGYVVYDSVSEIVDSLADIFPYFLYLVAALVASTTMARMVNEERVNIGTLCALGYGRLDIMLKFLVYGAAAALLGAAIGIAAGHLLMPAIVYNAYATGFTLPAIELHLDMGVTLFALVLSLITAVAPAWIAAARELTEKPCALLLPRAPASGSKVLLEHVGLIWRRLNFIGKVTVRNLFRFKVRALMTILGVAGAVGMLFAGFAVQNSISGIVGTQFGEIIGYDLIVAEDANISADERADIEGLLSSDEVEAFLPVHYDAVTKQAGNKGDEQDITLLVSDGTDDFASYLHLRDRESGQTLELSDDGAIISERIASLTGTEAGDTFTFTDEDGIERSVRVAGICEMYMNHFIFMSPAVYRQTFSQDADTNAYVATLGDASLENTERVAAEFMAIPGVEGVVQSTALINMIDIIVTALNKIMVILIVIASLLAMVVLYNLVTVNVSERIRELSTVKVLGFRPREVTMYIYRETICLSIIGIPAGWAFGRFLQLYIISAVPPETVMFNPDPGWLCFAVSAAVIAAVVFLLYFAVNRRLRRVDMLEALKSVD